MYDALTLDRKIYIGINWLTTVTSDQSEIRFDIIVIIFIYISVAQMTSLAPNVIFEEWSWLRTFGEAIIIKHGERESSAWRRLASGRKGMGERG